MGVKYLNEFFLKKISGGIFARKTRPCIPYKRIFQKISGGIFLCKIGYLFLYIYDMRQKKLSLTRILLEGSPYDKIIVLGKDKIDELRRINKNLDAELRDPIYKIPKFYAKGGAARLALQLYVDPNRFKDEVIRDRDFVYVGRDDDYMDALNKMTIPNGYDGGEVDMVLSVEQYMKSRDFTFNEVMMRPDELIFTRRALRDVEKRVVNPKNLYAWDTNGDRVASRAILFAARYGYDFVNNARFGNQSGGDFLMFIALLKAFQLNIQDRFFELLKKLRYADGASNLFKYLVDTMKRHMTPSILMPEPLELHGQESKIARMLVDGKWDIDRDFLAFYPDLEKEVDKMTLLDKYEDAELINKFLKKKERGKIKTVDKHNKPEDFGITEYEFDKQGRLNVFQNVNLSNQNLTELPFNFGIVDGDFDCHLNRLKSLKGAPIKTKDFDCSDNELTSLMGGPMDVDGAYWCTNNQLVSFNGMASTINGNLNCSDNQFKSLANFPKIILGWVRFNGNRGKRFTKQQIHDISDVKRHVEVY